MVYSSDRFKDAYEKAYNKFIVESELNDKIKQVDETISLINQCISKSTDQKTNYPIIVGNILSRASITNIGVFPPYKVTENFIYPLKYSVKKRFKSHKNYKKTQSNKVLYVCVIEHNGVTITADDGYVWKGDNVWNEFKSDVGINDEFKSLEDFMALNHPVIIKLIEEIGDISRFENYIPFSERNSNKK